VPCRGDISTTERKAYLDGVLCLLNTPSKLDPARYPGAKNRYDDFVVVHMNQTLSIHGTVCLYPLVFKPRLNRATPERNAAEKGSMEPFESLETREKRKRKRGEEKRGGNGERWQGG